MTGSDRDAPKDERRPTRRQYDARVNTDEGGRPATYRRARRNLGDALDDLTVRAKQLISARYQRNQRGSLIREARRLRADSIDIVTYAVLSERAAGATWTEVSAALSLEESFVREHYEPIEQQWIGGDGIGPMLNVRKQDGQRLRLVSG